MDWHSDKALPAAGMRTLLRLDRARGALRLREVGILSTEFYASTFRHLEISGSTTFPTEEWRVPAPLYLTPPRSQPDPKIAVRPLRA